MPVRDGQSKKRSQQRSSPLLLIAAGLIPLGIAAFSIPKLIDVIRSKYFPPNKQDSKTIENGTGIYYGGAPTIRKHYKVNREQQLELLQDNRPDIEIQDNDDVVETYEEDDVEKAGAMGGGNKEMLSMLQQMGFRLVMGPDGTMMLVAPGKEGNLGLEGYEDDE
uniref:Uncharacterized protein n=1 Tax=Polytomella parva TaxID=51329 RepID=A0A7S0V898_9CHLO|mmetsp:Transcript_30043/g.54930  ORF Transcript_30043/g.54930 Transcript_30043/m.54930 type:complete len:164 (+) Transcript_30043:112-603(+)|eukprot:CAMPEP_0175045402 /NCGR_PEP_ID=MMETSP0052_2-20121109/4399_1 /TAXON_ID=51329 ORGANISM="Polytomella parva, Strain SAG 63-3" /NCGR_SAMPLE_ID=MMETSP0052_2 /ASSEMBLY_ACC=CAM_ASM_000194 /LENGTH=163 /DNA_ID=CAMNT_0016308921 /DNA_START=46 /DNA_END=537 /DNA_ORIENTATION=-